MRLRFFVSIFLGLVAFSDYASCGESNLSVFGAPRHNLDGVLPVLDIEEQYIRSQTDGSSKALGDAVLQCSATKPCPDGSCCNAQGNCGYRDEHCKQSCVADCGAKAPCGVNSKDGKQSCPLNVCCSYFGFCGASEAFCRDVTESGLSTPCQKGFGKCGTVKTKATPTCGKGSGTASRRIAYYEGWNTRRRPCDKVWPTDIDTTGLTHLIFSFATIDPATFAVKPMHPGDEKLYADFLGMKDGSQKWIGIGGWEFSDAGATRTTWSEMASSKANREAFITSLLKFLDKWEFAGVDIDWEWPGAETRGGNPAIDKQNQVNLLKEVREALGSRGLSTVAPVQFEYLKRMDPKVFEASVDFFNILAYDLHGPWDAAIPGLGPILKPHTDLKEIDKALDLFWFNEVTPSKINLGVANYGRGYTLTDPSCAEYGCSWIGPSKAGECTELAGVLSQCEIQRIISRKQLKPEILEGGAGIKQIVFDGQWVGYDDSETLALKKELANNRCLGGTALWAIDYASCGGGHGGGPGAPDVSNALSSPSVSGVPVTTLSSTDELDTPSVPATSSVQVSNVPGFSAPSISTESAALPAPEQSESQASLTTKTTSVKSPWWQSEPPSTRVSSQPSQAESSQVATTTTPIASPFEPSTWTSSVGASKASTVTLTVSGSDSTTTEWVIPTLSTTSSAPLSEDPIFASPSAPEQTTEVHSSDKVSTLISRLPSSGSTTAATWPASSETSKLWTTTSALVSSTAWVSTVQSTGSTVASSRGSKPASSLASSPQWSSTPSSEPSSMQLPTSDAAQTSSGTSMAISASEMSSSDAASTQLTSENGSVASSTGPLWSSSASPSSTSPDSDSQLTSLSWMQSSSAQTSSANTSSVWRSSTGTTFSGSSSIISSIDNSASSSLVASDDSSFSSTGASSSASASAQSSTHSSSMVISIPTSSSGTGVVTSATLSSDPSTSAETTNPSSASMSGSTSDWSLSSVSASLGDSTVSLTSSTGSSSLSLPLSISSTTSQSALHSTTPSDSSSGLSSWSQSSMMTSSSSSFSWSLTSSMDGSWSTPLTSGQPSSSSDAATTSTLSSPKSSGISASSVAKSSKSLSDSDIFTFSQDPTSAFSQTQNLDTTTIGGDASMTSGDEVASASSTLSTAPNSLSASRTTSAPALSQTLPAVPTGAFVNLCPNCSESDWCKPLAGKMVHELPSFPPVQCADSEWCLSCWPKPLEYRPEICPWQCYLLDWCRPFCVSFEQHPEEIPLPGIRLKWFRDWWWSTRVKGCQPNDCKDECDGWYGLTLALFQTPVCPCVPRTCTKGEKEDNQKKKKCKLLGCGCGWMGLPFGPGCKGIDLKVKWPDLFPYGFFGPDPCKWFGGCLPPPPPGPPPPPPPPPHPPPDEEWGEEGCGPLGCRGYCYSDEGCDPCPPEICKGPKCTRIGGCGPRVGPDPTPNPTRKPKQKCEEKDKTTVTERIVSCFIDLELEPTTIASINFTLTETLTSACIPFEATYTGCGILGISTTTTVSSYSTLSSSSSEPPMCTRAPLDLNNDEGDNEHPAPRTTDGPVCSRAPLSLDDDEGDNEHEGPSCTRAPLDPDNDQGDNMHPTSTAEGPSCTRAPLFMDDDEGDNPIFNEGPSCSRAPLLLDDDEGDNSQQGFPEGPACTRAPLSLDDDEGSNEMPSDLLSSMLSSMYSNSTMLPTPTSNSSWWLNSTSRVLPPSTLSMLTSLPWGNGIPSGAPVETIPSRSLPESSSASSLIPSGTPKANCPTCNLVFSNCVKESCKSDGSNAVECAKLCLSDLCYGNHEADYCKRGPCKPAACPEKNPGNLYEGEPSIPFTTVLTLPGTTLTVTATASYPAPTLSHSPTPTCNPGHTITQPGGKWTALIEHEMKERPSEAVFTWTLWDEHGCKAGEGKASNVFLGYNITTDIGAPERTPDYRMGYMLQTNVTDSLSGPDSEIEFRMSKPVEGCTEMCWVKWKINNRDATQSWQISDDCARQCGSPQLSTADVTCDDGINKWHESGDSSIKKRGGYCTWRMPFKPKNDDGPPPPAPLKPWGRDGRWTLDIVQWMEYEESSLEYWLKDPNGVLVKHIHWDTSKEMDGAAKLIATTERETSYLQYGMAISLWGLREKDKSILRLTYQNEIFPKQRPKGCGICFGHTFCPEDMRECAPFYQTESNDEKSQSLFEDCSFDNTLDKKRKWHALCERSLFKDNLEFSCDPVPDAYYPKGAGFERRFKCWWPHDFVEPNGNQPRAARWHYPEFGPGTQLSSASMGEGSGAVDISAGTNDNGSWANATWV